LLPSCKLAEIYFSIYKMPNNSHARSTDYLTGLRGIAALFVYHYHLALPFTEEASNPYQSWSKFSLLQLPILRIFYAGFQMVGLFFALSGFVLTAKLAYLAKRGESAEFSKSLASSIFRRAWRLYLPILPSTFLVMLAAYSGLLYEGVPNEDVKDAAPILQENILWQIWDWTMFLFWDLGNVWSFRPLSAESNYGAHLYTIPWEMRDSMIVYICAIGLGTLRSYAFYTSTLLIQIYCYVYVRWDISLFIGGLVLANYSQSSTFIRMHNKTPRACFIAVFLLGIYLSSLPVEKAGHFGLTSQTKLPMVCGNLLILAATIHSKIIQQILSLSWIQYLGNISFSLYIIHEPLLRLFGWRMVAWFASKTNGSLAVGFIATWLIFTPFLLALASIYWMYVDQPAINFARWLESRLRIRREVDGDEEDQLESFHLGTLEK